MDFEHGIIGWYGLKRDVGVPASGSKTADIGQLVCQTTALLLLFTADDGNLIAELRTFFSQRVNM
jgi:hypothetical protein